MKKYKTLSKIFQYGLVAVIRGDSKEEAINLENLDKWFENGVIAVGVGSNLTSTFNGNDYSSVSVVAKQYVERINSMNINFRRRNYAN
jgi:2-keto-3-deoxy-6-phosphogluconate aldolase